jgi:hypothetical protein
MTIDVSEMTVGQFKLLNCSEVAHGKRSVVAIRSTRALERHCSIMRNAGLGGSTRCEVSSVAKESVEGTGRTESGRDIVDRRDMQMTACYGYIGKPTCKGMASNARESVGLYALPVVEPRCEYH